MFFWDDTIENFNSILTSTDEIKIQKRWNMYKPFKQLDFCSSAWPAELPVDGVSLKNRRLHQTDTDLIKTIHKNLRRCALVGRF